ncbi:MAG TPA: GAF domain-containing protein, partial [Polyangiaceae bacterium]
MSASANPHEAEPGARAGSEQLLADAAALLAESLELRAIVAKLTALAVAAFADFCVVDLLNDDDHGETFDRVAVSGRAPQSDELARALIRRYPVRGPTLSGVSAVLLEGKSILLRDFPASRLDEIARDAQHLDTLRALGARSALSVPLITRGRVLGALSFIVCERNFDEKDR